MLTFSTLSLSFCCAPVDKRYEAVILPIYGVMTPFHISFIKNASQTEEGEFSYLRINFNTPGVTTIKNDTAVRY